ncbi:heparinase II/III-family protein [Horticoccus luteus]|uniref:Heparinase II/III-family protein n=1 Tax=Horticoccus luteus TaxID=2862869 RepID=A0A8F9TWW1_9BACT|nr:heparinase II/III family protein [Horticoccus luteus]QYM79233.1 heparinase II/III-family protein [Horticoccus luteus]
MRLIPLNSAEAVFEPFFDENLSEINEWKVDAPGALGLSLKPGWAFVTYQWEQAAADGLVLRMRRDYAAFDCADYDRLVVTINAPEESVVTIAAETDAGPRRMTGEPVGATRREEELPLEGATRIDSLTVEVRNPHPGAGSGWLLWFGLQSSTRLPAHLAQWTGYDERWEKYLQPAEFEPTFTPSYGLLIDAEELAAVRAGFAQSPVTRELREGAETARAVRPESLIGENMPYWSTNMLRRARDSHKLLSLHGPIAAQAGLLWRDKALCRLAARFALSIAHCGHWEDVFFAHTPGCTWEQRGFIAAVATWDCALILDLCGEWFTPLGRELVLRRIATEAHGRMCHASWWWEYMYHGNQLAWISPARLYGLLELERHMPARLGPYPPPERSRVAAHTEAAWADLQDNLAKALLPDGGYLEGVSYFTYTARQAFLCATLYGRARGVNPRDLIPAALLRTDRLAEMLLSTDREQDMLLTGDAMFPISEGLAFLAWLMPQSHWVTIYRRSLQRAGSAPLLLPLRLEAEIPAEGPPLRAFCEMPDTGMMCSVRRHAGELVKLFIMGNKSGGDHQHEDKGSFVLEFAGESFAMDFGVLDYANPVTDLLKHAQRHTMLAPWSDDERPRPANPIYADIKPQGTGDAERFHASAELAAGWEGWFKRWRRTWDSPQPTRFVITDEWEVERGEGVIFYWTTPLPIRREGDCVIIEGERARAVVRVPAGVDAVIELLPLQDPRRTSVETVYHGASNRRQSTIAVEPGHGSLFGWRHAATQPRLSLRQRGRAGTLRVEVELALK